MTKSGYVILLIVIVLVGGFWWWNAKKGGELATAPAGDALAAEANAVNLGSLDSEFQAIDKDLGQL